MTGPMLIELERVIEAHTPERVMVYGDTNSTLAGALAAAKLHVLTAHVEVGLQSLDRRMSEEANRVLTDHVSTTLLYPTPMAVGNLKREGLGAPAVAVNFVGDVMQDASILFRALARQPAGLKAEVANGSPFVLATIHRGENTDDPISLQAIVEGLNRVHLEIAPVVLPFHPRTRSAIERGSLGLEVLTREPVGYAEMIWLLEHAGLVITDSGGLQKEAYFFATPCVTVRDSTEWTELLDVGANQLEPANASSIVRPSRKAIGRAIEVDDSLFGGGKAAEHVAAAFTIEQDSA